MSPPFDRAGFERERATTRPPLVLALIAAGGFAIPIAAAVKACGRVGPSLGGHLQVMFGVHGQRWLGRREWREEIINDAWIGVPGRYRPDPAWTVED